MASNRELKAEAEALGEELGVSVETKGLGNAALTELVEGLREQASEPVPVQSEPNAPSAPKASAGPARMVVAPGRAITSTRGLLKPGTEVQPAFFAGDGAAVLANLVATGHVIEQR